jgi:hypothetical protein
MLAFQKFHSYCQCPANNYSSGHKTFCLYGTQRFTTVFRKPTNGPHTRLVQIFIRYFCKVYSDIILPLHLHLPSAPPLEFPNQNNALFLTLARIQFLAGAGPALGLTQLPIKWIERALFLGVKWTWLEADHSSPSST